MSALEYSRAFRQEVEALTPMLLLYSWILMFNSYFIRMWACLCVSVCVSAVPSEVTGFPGAGVSGVESCLTWVLGWGPEPSAGAAAAVSHRVISPS